MAPPPAAPVLRSSARTTLLANAMLRSHGHDSPAACRRPDPERVAFCVGTQINGAPHLGTSLVQTAAFLLAKATKRTFNVDVVVRFGALGQRIRTTSVLDPETHHAYQQTYYHVLGGEGVA